MNMLATNRNLEIVTLEATSKQPLFEDNNLEKMFSIQANVNELSKNNIAFSTSLITQNDKPLFFPKTINIIQGKMGSHKSRIAEHLVSVLLSKEADYSILGFKKNTSDKLTVVYIDTERNLKEQFPYTIQTIKRNAGYDKKDEIPNFEFSSLLDVSRDKRLETFNKYLEHIRKKHFNHIFVIIDVISDCISNFNDVRESMMFIDLLNVMINKFDVTFLCVIHENPGSIENKARGHLGTELSNKSTTVISVNVFKETLNIYEVKFIKCRSSERYPSYHIKYNTQTTQLELTDAIEVKEANQNKAPYSEVMRLLLEILKNQPMARKKLIAELRIKFDCSERIAIERINNILDTDRMAQHGYKLTCENVPNKTNNQKQYRLEEIKEQNDLFPNK